MPLSRQAVLAWPGGFQPCGNSTGGRIEWVSQRIIDNATEVLYGTEVYFRDVMNSP